TYLIAVAIFAAVAFLLVLVMIFAVGFAIFSATQATSAAGAGRSIGAGLVAFFVVLGLIGMVSLGLYVWYVLLVQQVPDAAGGPAPGPAARRKRTMRSTTTGRGGAGGAAATTSTAGRWSWRWGCAPWSSGGSASCWGRWPGPWAAATSGRCARGGWTRRGRA